MGCAPRPWDMTHPDLIPPAFILVEPQMGENIGAAARAMLNFGLTQMRVVNPRDGWPNERAVAMASGAGRVLDAAARHDTTRAAIADLHYVFATTARPRDLIKPVFTPEQALSKASEMAHKGLKTGILFGPEAAGLQNEDIVQVDAIITVPVNPDFASLNLGQCVLLMAYEWGRQTLRDPQVLPEKSRPATQGEIAILTDHFEEKLDKAGFFFPPPKAEHMKLNLRNMLARLPLTLAEVQIFHGMLRQFARWKETGDDPHQMGTGPKETEKT